MATKRTLKAGDLVRDALGSPGRVMAVLSLRITGLRRAVLVDWYFHSEWTTEPALLSAWNPNAVPPST